MEGPDSLTQIVAGVLMALGAATMSPAIEVRLEKHKDQPRLLVLIALVGAAMILVAVPLTMKGVPSGQRLAALLKYWPVLFGGFIAGTAYYFIMRLIRRGWLVDEQARLSRAIDESVAAIRGDFDVRLDSLATKADTASQGEVLAHLAVQVAELGRNLAAVEARLDHLREEVAAHDEYTAGLEKELASVPAKIRKAVAAVRSEIHSSFTDHMEMLDEESKNRIEETPPIKLTAAQIYDEIQAIELSVRREYSRRYLRSYIKWNCWISGRQEIGKEVRLGLRIFPKTTKETFLSQDIRHALIGITAIVRNTPAVLQLKENEPVTLTGRICGIDANHGSAFWIDDADVQGRQ